MALILAAFTVSMCFTAGAVLWRAKIEEAHYGELRIMALRPQILTPLPTPPAAHPIKPPRLGWGI